MFLNQNDLLTGVALLALLVPLQTKIAGLMGKYRKATLEKTDRRVTLMTEIMSGMRVIKYYAWYVIRIALHLFY